MRSSPRPFLLVGLLCACSSSSAVPGGGLDGGHAGLDGGAGSGGGAALCDGLEPIGLEAVFTSELMTCASAACHGNSSNPSRFVFTDAPSFWAAAVNQPSVEASALLRVAPGDPANSYVYQKLAGTAAVGAQMPFGMSPLSASQLSEMAAWICAGAPPSPDGGAAAADGGSDGGADGGGAANPLPVLTSITPTAIPVGSGDTAVGLGGSGFVQLSQVEVDGNPVQTQFVDDTSLVAVVPQADLASAGVHLVAVSNPAPGGGTSASQALTVENPVPSITSLAPASVSAGSGALALSVTGSGFVAASQVELDGAPVATTYAGGALSAAIDGAVTAVGGVHPITVVNAAPGGGASAPVTFTVDNPAPSLTSIAPSTVATNGAAFTLTLTGSGFVATSAVTFQGSPVATTYVGPTSLTAAIPTIAAPGSYAVAVQNPSPGGGGSPTLDLTAQASSGPSITGVSPTSGPAGSAFSLTVTGAGYQCGGGTPSQLLFNGQGLTISSCSTTQLLAQVPATAAGSYPLLVQNGGGLQSNTVTYTLSSGNPVPLLSSLSPSSATAGGTAFTLTADGSSFVSGAVLSFNGNARTTTFVSASQVTADILASDVASAGSYPVTVANPAPGGGASHSLAFTVAAPAPVPVLSALSPSSANAGGSAFTLDVTGSGFTSSSVVQWNGSSRTTTYVSATQLTAAILASDIAAAGSATVTAATPAPGGGTSNGLAFTVLAANPVPVLASLSPCGLVAGSAGFTLTLDGSSFVSGATVSFNGSALGPATFVSATQLTVAVPGSLVASAPSGDAAPVVVTNPGPGGGPSNSVDFGIATQTVTLSGNVQSIFSASCATAGCHVTGGAAPMSLQSGQSYGNLVGVTSSECPPTLRVRACGPLPTQSYVAAKILDQDICFGSKMPKGSSLPASTIQTIVDWIAQGAPQ